MASGLLPQESNCQWGALALSPTPSTGNAPALAMRSASAMLKLSSGAMIVFRLGMVGVPEGVKGAQPCALGF